MNQKPEQKTIHNERGFTLLESLLVLSIITIIGTVLITNMMPVFNKKVVNNFLIQLEKDIMFAQQYALINKEPVYIIFEQASHQYTITANGFRRTLLVRNYDSNVKINGDNLVNRITFNTNGSIQRSGTIRISYFNFSFKVIFYLGKGRFKIVE